MPRFVRVHELGGPQNLVLEDGPAEAPGSGELRVKIEAIGLNRAESNIRSGTYLQRPPLPTRLGYEAAGRVTAVGENCDGFSVGDFVSFIPGNASDIYGTYAEEAIMPAAQTVHTPESIAPDAAAAMWMQYLTAYGGLVEAGGLVAGETVLITAASSSVGLAAIEICRKLGATPIATTRGPGKVDRLLAAGAEHVVVTSETPVDEAVMAVTGGAGVHLVFDPVIGGGLEALGRAAAFNGRIIIYGGIDGPTAPYPVMPGIMKGLTMRGFYLLELTGKPDWFARGKAFVLGGLADGSLVPHIDRSFALADIHDAHAYLDSGAQFGKIIVRP